MRAFILLSASLSFPACVVDRQAQEREFVEQVGETMAAIDEMGGSRGAFAQRAPRRWPSFGGFTAHAGSCASDVTFGACTGSKVVRTFGGCRTGVLEFQGKVTFTFANADGDCRVDETGETVARDPDYVVTGALGDRFVVAKTGSEGQVLTNAGGQTYSYRNDGIRKTYTSFNTEVFAFTSRTLDPVTVVGKKRAGRIMDAGSIRVTDETRGAACTFVPNDVTWTAGCNCATSGTWTANCDRDDSFTLELTGCGEGKIRQDDETRDAILSRCVPTAG